MGSKASKPGQCSTASKPGDLEVLLDMTLGGVGSAQCSLHYLAQRDDPKKFQNAAAVIVCGDPIDVSAPKWAAHAVKESGAPVLVISGAAGPAGTQRLLANASNQLQEMPVYDEAKGWRLPLASKFSQTDWVKEEKDLMESDIYLELVLNELQQIDPNMKPTDVTITVNELLPNEPLKKLRIVLENKSTNSGENATKSEKLLRNYLKDFQPPNGQPKKVIFVKAPLLLLRGCLTFKNPGPKTLENAEVEKAEWLGGVTEVLSYADACPRLADLDPLGRVEVLEKAAGEYKRICNYNNIHLTVEEDFDQKIAEGLVSWLEVLPKIQGLAACPDRV